MIDSVKVITPGALVEVKTREVFKHHVIDVLRGHGRAAPYPALVLCVECGTVWNEGASFIPTCPPCRMLDMAHE